MKIAFPIFVYQNGKSGISTYVRELIRHLPQNHEYHLYLPEKDAHHLPFGIHHKQYNFFEKSLCNFVWTNALFSRTAKKYDLVHCPCACKAALTGSFPQIATMHDLGPYRFKEKYGTLHHWYHRMYDARGLARCAHIIAVSHSTKKDLMRFLNIPEEKISVIYSGIDHTFFKPVEAPRRENPYFIYVSRIEHPSKNHVRLIEAFELFQRKHKTNHDLLFVGQDWNGAASVHERAQRSPYAKQIQFLGFVDRNALPALYSNTDLMIFPSLFEGFGFPLIEAAACGAKVISSNRASLGELALLGNIPTFDPIDPESIAIAMQRELLAPKENRDTFVNRFSWGKTAADVVRIYERYQ